MSKKLIYVRIIIASICLLFLGLFIFMIVNIQKTMVVEDKTVEETIEEKIVFDMALPPSQQKNLRGHVREYFSQVYDYLYKDIKWKNIQESYPYRYSELREKKDKENFYRILKLWPYRNLFLILFNSDNKDMFEKIYLTYPLNLDDIPVTENYKEKHPKPLFEEFSFIKKENYRTKDYYDKYNEYNYWYEFDYSYGIGVDEETKTICVGEKKSVSKLYIENGIEKSGIVYNKEGNEVSAYVETKDFYFTYTTDEKGYVDDIVYDRTETITADKYLDNLIRY